MSSLLQWKDSHLCNPRLCALIQVIRRRVDENAALRIHSSSSQIKLYFSLCLYVLLIRMHRDTFINYKKKLKLSFLVLENNYAIKQLSWGIDGDG